MTHAGAAFTADNGDLYSLIVQHTEGTEGYSLVQAHERRRNGRQAWLDLTSHFEGATFKERIAQEAGQAIRTAKCTGPKRNFTFGDYYSRHSQAHIKLLKAGKPMTIEQQIDAFVQGIQCATTQAIVVNLAGVQAVRTSFDVYYNAVASKLELAMTLTGKSNNNVTRNVSQVTKTSNPPKRKNSGDSNSQKNSKRSNNNFKPEARRYSAEEWKSLSSEQKTQVKALHNIMKSNRHNSNNSFTTGNEQAIVPYGMNVNPTNRQCSQMHSYDTGTHASYINTPCTNFPHYGRYVNQLSYQNNPSPPTPSVTIPPPPPTRASTNSSGSLTAESGEVGNSWGGYPFNRNN